MNEFAKSGGLDKTAFRVFSSFEEAEAADREYYRSLSPTERLDILLLLREFYSPYSDELTKGFERVCRIIERLDVRFLIIGAFAVAYHGYPRYTSDIDIFVDKSAENAELLLKAIREFGFGDIGLSKEDFIHKDQVIQLGVAPNRIDMMTSISGVNFEEAWSSREFGELGKLKVPFISRDMLKRNKQATGRGQDLVDLEHL